MVRKAQAVTKRERRTIAGTQAVTITKAQTIAETIAKARNETKTRTQMQTIRNQDANETHSRPPGGGFGGWGLYYACHLKTIYNIFRVN